MIHDHFLPILCYQASLPQVPTDVLNGLEFSLSLTCLFPPVLQGAIQLDLLEKWLPPPEAGAGGAVLDETITNFKVTLDPTDNGEAEDASSNTSLSRWVI